MAALEGSNDLAEVLGDDATSSELVESLTAVEEGGAEPVGAYLRSITVQGFRGIGAEVTLPFRPGPGLTVVAGRNGSGKSTLAEGLELALTGTNSRWNDRAAVWSQNWRNLHAGDPAHIRSVSPKKVPAQRQLVSTGRLAKVSISTTSGVGAAGRQEA